MDRHMKWLRRRIVASIATQTAETFAAVVIVAFAVMQWRTDEGPLTALFGSVVIAQLVAVARIGHAMRNNPLNYVFMREYVDHPFSYRVTRFQDEEQAHPVAAKLPGFAPVATIRDSDADPEPIFDIYHDPSRLVAASISRASGSVALISSLGDGRILVTDARAMPPQEGLVMSLAEDDSVETVIATHRRALSARTDVVQLASSAHQVVLDSLALEYDAYVALGPALSPFLDLEPGGRSGLRLIARIKPEELIGLPTRLGPDLPMMSVRTINQQASAAGTAPSPRVESSPAPDLNIPQVVAPQITGSPIATPEVASPQVVQVVAPEPVVSPVVEVAAPQLVEVVAPDPIAAEPRLEQNTAPEQKTEPETPVVTPEPVAADVIAPLVPAADAVEAPVVGVESVPIAEIAPPAFVTVEPDAVDLDTHREPVTAEVPAVVITPIATESQANDTAAVVQASPALEHAEAPLDLAAAIASLATVSAIAPAPADAAEAVTPDALTPEPDATVFEATEPDPAPGEIDDAPTSALPAVDVVEVAVPVVPTVVEEPVAPLPAVDVVEVAVPVVPTVVEEPVASLPAAPVAEVAVPVDVPVEPLPAAPAQPEPSVEAPAFVYTTPSGLPPGTPAQPVEETLPDFILQPPPATLAEAVMPAPDTPAALGAPPVAGWPAPSMPFDDGEPMLVSSLGAALGETEELSPTRPRLSAVIRANNAAPKPSGGSGRRSRRKSR